MVEIAARPILEHNVRLLARHGVRDIIINLHYCPQAISDFFGDGAQFGVSITYSYEPALCGTAGALLNVRDRLDRPFILLYGDNLTDIDISRLVTAHTANAAVMTMAVFERPDSSASGVAEIDESGRIIRFVEKPRPGQIDSSWVNAGILVLEPAVLNYIPAERASDVARDVVPAVLSAGGRIMAYRMSENLWWVDSLDDYERTVAAFARGAASLESTGRHQTKT